MLQEMNYILDYTKKIKEEDFNLELRKTYLEKLKDEGYLKQFICDHKFFFSLYHEALIRGDETIECFIEGFVSDGGNLIYNKFVTLANNLYFPNANKTSFIEYKEYLYTDSRLKKEIKSLEKQEFINKGKVNIFHDAYKPSFNFRLILKDIRNNQNLLSYCEKMKKKTIMQITLENK